MLALEKLGYGGGATLPAFSLISDGSPTQHLVPLNPLNGGGRAAKVTRKAVCRPGFPGTIDI